MSISKIRPWLLLALIFIVGIVTGSALTILLRPYFAHSPGMGQMKEHLLVRLTHRLNLTPEQQAKIDPILSESVTQAQAVHHDEVARMTQIMETTHHQITAILTPEQQAEWQKMMSEEHGFSGHRHGRGGPSHGGPGGPPPPDH